MAHFISDNTAGVHPQVMASLAACNSGPAPAYGQDRWTQALEARMEALCTVPVAVALVGSGTAANALGLSLYTPPYGSILCHQHAHILSDEYGAPGFFSGGAQLWPLAGEHGKITPEAFSAALAEAAGKLVKPAMLSLSLPTESGTAYSAQEVAALCDMAHHAGMGVQVDGARFANVAAQFGGLAQLAACGVNVLSFGGSKNGCMAAEMVVVMNPTPGAASQLSLRRKQSGHTTAKARYQAAQFLAYLQDNLWLTLAAHANSMAQLLASWVQQGAGMAPLHPVQANMVFYALSPAQAESLRQAGHEFLAWHDGSYRFVMSYSTTTADIMALADSLAAVRKAAA
ncbi:MAG: low specificity L-threonine aldolase [Proteobacteria bacterium]|nr:low specificity L-threonine aldolase [Pseudomonadota bacterium]